MILGWVECISATFKFVWDIALGMPVADILVLSWHVNKFILLHVVINAAKKRDFACESFIGAIILIRFCSS
jgi:hypothetical protein